MSWIVAARLDWIPLRGARVLLVGNRTIALFRTVDDSVYALRDRCPHKGGPLSQGIVHGRCVTCPLHDWVIDLATGLAEGPDEGATATYPVRVEDGRVYLSLPAEPSEAESSEAESSEAESSQAESSQAEPSQAESSQAESSQAEPSEAEPSEAAAAR